MILVIRTQTLVFCLASGMFLYEIGHDLQTQRRFLMRIMGLRHTPYYLGYFLCDYLYYLVPNLLIIVNANAAQIDLFIDYQVVKDTSIVVFGVVIIPLAYLIGFAFKDYDNAFRHSGIILYSLGFMIADAVMAITEADFFRVTPNESAVKYIAMLDPFVFYYWSQGFPAKNDMSN